MNEKEKNLCHLLSLFEDDFIPRQLLEPFLQKNNGKSYLKKIRSLYIINGEDPYRIHSFTQYFFREKLDELEKEEAENMKKTFCQTIATEAKEIPASLNLASII